MSAPYKLGLTGSIGMGKTTTAKLFADLGVPVWDADATVHALYGPGAAGTAAIARLAPQSTGPDGVHRAALRKAIAADKALLPAIEAAIHPLVAEERASFIANHADAPMLLFDIPLLYETGADAWLDGVVVVTAPATEQRRRVLARGEMDEDTLAEILLRQTPDVDKRARADHVIDTTRGLDAARHDVQVLISKLGGGSHA